MRDPAAGRPSAFSRYVARASDVFGYASALLILLSMLVITYGAVLRYLIGASTVWQTELSVYLLMFATLCGAAYGLRHGDHVSIDLVTSRLPAGLQRVVGFVAAGLGLLLVATLAGLSFHEWWLTTEAGERSGTAWNPPLTVPHLIVPVGMTLLTLQYLALIVEMAQRTRTHGAEPAPEVDRPVTETAT